MFEFLPKKALTMCGIVVASALPLSVHSVLFGQSLNANANSDKITLVSTDNPPPPGERILVMRRASGADQNVIVLPTDATASDLAVALGSLARARQRDGGVLAHPEERIGITSGSVSGPLGAPQVRFESMLKQLQRARPRFVRGIGTVTALEVNVHVAAATQK